MELVAHYPLVLRNPFLIVYKYKESVEGQLQIPI